MVTVRERVEEKGEREGAKWRRPKEAEALATSSSEGKNEKEKQR